ncbi:MAG TPA: N-acetylmuramoyl-L-alanine amidase [Burkholderiales bacterium]
MAFLLCACAIATTAWGQAGAPDSDAIPVHPAPLIALDVGHYLAAPGATSARGVPEFEFNRALVLAIAARLKAAGYRTELIGIDGQAAELAGRPRRAREVGATLFLSVHHDSARERFLRDWEYEGKPRKYLDQRFQGYSLFVSRQNPQWRQSLECASTLGTQLRAAGFKPSRYHADPRLGEAREFADEANGVHFFDNLAVLRNSTNMPALLFEAGVIVNREEEARMGEEATRARIADAVAQAMPACVIDAIRARGIPVPISAAAPVPGGGGASPARRTTRAHHAAPLAAPAPLK